MYFIYFEVAFQFHDFYIFLIYFSIVSLPACTLLLYLLFFAFISHSSDNKHTFLLTYYSVFFLSLPYFFLLFDLTSVFYFILSILIFFCYFNLSPNGILFILNLHIIFTLNITLIDTLCLDNISSFSSSLISHYIEADFFCLFNDIHSTSLVYWLPLFYQIQTCICVHYQCPLYKIPKFCFQLDKNLQYPQLIFSPFSPPCLFNSPYPFIDTNILLFSSLSVFFLQLIILLFLVILLFTLFLYYLLQPGSWYQGK